MVIIVDDGCTDLKCLLYGSSVFVKRDVQHGDLVTRLWGDFVQQVYVALDAGNERGLLWVGQAQLVECTNAVRITVEEVIIHLS